MAATEGQDLPTILLVQGSFQVPQVYDKLVQGLVARGYPVVHPRLPSCTDTESPDFPKRTLADDASTVHAELNRLIENDGKRVMVIMHSYGGLVGSEAVTEGLSRVKRQEKALPGGVVQLFFYAAFMLHEGESVLGNYGESPNNDVRPNGTFYIRNGEKLLYNDLPPAESSSWAARLIAQSHAVETTKITRAAWRYVPSTYLICENDQAAPPQFQEMFATNAKSRIERCNSGHSPHLSQPEMLVEKIHEATQKAINA